MSEKNEQKQPLEDAIEETQEALENALEDDVTEDELYRPMEKFFYHQRRAMEETGRALEALMPPGFREHSTNASQEFTKGFRILVDAAIDELKRVSEREDTDAQQDADAPDEDNKKDDDDDNNSSTGKNKVRVKVD